MELVGCVRCCGKKFEQKITSQIRSRVDKNKKFLWFREMNDIFLCEIQEERIYFINFNNNITIRNYSFDLSLHSLNTFLI